jgi:hypothetical protein
MSSWDLNIELWTVPIELTIVEYSTLEGVH